MRGDDLRLIERKQIQLLGYHKERKRRCDAKIDGPKKTNAKTNNDD